MSDPRPTFVKNSVLFVTVIATNALGNFALSHGMRQMGEMVEFSLLPYMGALLNPWVAGGVCVLVVWLISQLSLLSRVDLSYLLPVTSVTYVVAALLGRLFQNEQVTLARWAGILIISFGVLLVARTRPHTSDNPPEGVE